ncbi:amidohydrolase family protein [Streptomyces sp. NPDC002870]|uniref:amidohydrolase family protein n=1 Tax=Streptomyces sp. NPDC002870 TaxID=3364666 RepID=UPI003692D58B
MALVTGAPIELPPLVDHHCHGVVRRDLDLRSFEAFLSESAAPAAPGTTFFDTQTGFAVRRWCPPLLGLEPHCPPERYLARRRELGAAEAGRRLLRAARIGVYVVDTGLPGDLSTPAELAAAGNAVAHEIVRLERLGELTADTCGTTDADSTAEATGTAGAAEAFVRDLAKAVRRAARTAVGFKSVAAYRHGLALAPEPPAAGEVARAAAHWLAGRRTGARLTDPVLLRHLLWTAVGTGLPLQLHTGFGDPDLRLDQADPVLLTDFVRATADTGTSLVLLHGYPYHRQAAYLANVFPHVHADVGLALTHSGVRAGAVLAEFLELAPFGKLLFSTDAYGLPELYAVGAEVFRDAVRRVVGGWVADGAWSQADAQRVGAMIAADNARRVYALE